MSNHFENGTPSDRIPSPSPPTTSEHFQSTNDILAARTTIYLEECRRLASAGQPAAAEAYAELRSRCHGLASEAMFHVETLLCAMRQRVAAEEGRHHQEAGDP